MPWKPKNQAEHDWLRGVNDALSLVSEWDKYVNHPYRLSDCIALKLNLKSKRQARRNKRAPHPLEAEVAQLRADGQRLRDVLVRAGEMVTLIAHGVTWEIAPSIQERARETETLVVAALAPRDAP